MTRPLMTRWMLATLIAILMGLLLVAPARSQSGGKVPPGPGATGALSTRIPLLTPTHTITPGPSLTPTYTPSPTLTHTPGPSPTPTYTPSPTPTYTPSPTPTHTPGPSPTPTYTPSPTLTPTPGPSPTPTHTPSPTPTPTICVLTYNELIVWREGFEAEVTIRNFTNRAVINWTLAWTFPHDEQITKLWWYGTYTQNGAQVRVTNTDWYGRIDPNGTVRIHFQATWSGLSSKPGSFTLNGVPCTVTP